MTQGPHPDYDTLLHHAASLAHPHGHPSALPHSGAGGHAPPHAMVPLHEVHSMLHGLRSDVAQLRQHQQQLPPSHHAAAPAPHHGSPPPHHDGGYDDEDRGRRSRHDQQHDRRWRYYEEEHTRRPRLRQPSGPLKVREFPVGFVQSGIGAGQMAEIEVKPQVRFQGHRLAVAASQARYFTIVDIKVGKDSQLAATGEMPAEAFSSLAVGTQMELDCAPPGIVITLIVRNTDTAPQDFGAVLYGEVEEGETTERRLRAFASLSFRLT